MQSERALKRAFWFGPRDREFAGIARSLEQHMDVVLASSEQAVPTAADLVVLAQYYPGAWSKSQLGALRSAWQSVPMVVLLGDWCCGIKRTHQELREFTTIYAHELVGQIDAGRILMRMAVAPRGKTGVAIATPRPATGNPFVALYARSRSYQQAIADTLSMRGVNTVGLSFQTSVLTGGVDHVIWEAAPDPELRGWELSELRRRHASAAVTSLCTFPRFEEFPQGEPAIRVLAQPFSISQLLDGLRTSDVDAASSAA